VGRAAATGRTGRRPGTSGTREAILAAARRQFGERGYDGTTFRSIAAEAAVDPALVRHFFGTKDSLFVAAVQWPFNPAEVLPDVLGPSLEGAGERLVRLFVRLWEDGPTRHGLTALLRSAAGNEQAAALLREFLAREVLGHLVARMEGPDRALRAALVGSQIVGLAVARYIVRVEPLARAEPDALVALVAPGLQRLFDLR